MVDWRRSEPPFHTTSAGLTVSVEPLTTPGVAALAMSVRAGSRYERPAVNGITHLVEHMLFRGSRAHPSALALASAFERLGAKINGSTSVDAMTFTAELPAELVPEALALLGELWRAPTFEGFTAEKRVVAAEIREDRAERDLELLVRETFWRSHPLSQPIAGSAGSVKRLRLDDVRGWWSEVSRLTNCHLSVAGDVERDVVTAAAETAFEGCPTGGWLAPRPAPLFEAGTVVHHVEGKGVTALAVAFAAGPLSAIQDAGLGLLLTLLDGGLASRLASRLTLGAGLAYRTRAGCQRYRDANVAAVEAVTGPSKGPRVLAELLQILAALCDDLVGDEERERALARWAFEARRDRLDPEGVVELAGEGALYCETIDEFERVALARRIGPETLRDIARGIFRPESMAVIARGPKTKAHVTGIEREVKAWTS